MMYALVPTSLLRRRARSLLQSSSEPLDLGGVGAGDIEAVISGVRGSLLEPYAVVCGQRSLEKDEKYGASMTTASDLTLSSPECVTLQAGASKAGQCLACPRLLPNTNYTLLVVGRNKYGDSDVLRTTFITTASGTQPVQPTSPSPPPPVQPSSRVPAFTTTPRATAAGESTLQLSLAVDWPGSIHYIVAVDQVSVVAE